EKPIIVLDEPTSGLDWENMRAVAEAVNYLRCKGKLIFIITHDLEFLSLTASRSLLIKNGVIAEDMFMASEKELNIIKSFMMWEGGR
ncbi:MAG: hypothetical protein K6E27_13585, partial [Eubacterium sp.]|nr:hypothetical protein [Eubacterium sp.]